MNRFYAEKQPLIIALNAVSALIIGVFAPVITLFWAWNFFGDAWLQAQLAQLLSYCLLVFYVISQLSTQMLTRHLSYAKWPYHITATAFFALGATVSFYTIAVN